MTKRSILKTIPALALATSALLLGGCMGTENRGLESVHQPVVSRADYAFDAATYGGALARGERERLRGWMSSLRLGYGDRVAIDDPSARADAARGQVAALVADFGLLLSQDNPVPAAPVAPDTIRIVVSRMSASVPGCPDWSRNESTEFNSNTSSNHGCSINATLAAMIARPEDLVRGVPGSGTVDTVASAKAIEAYRKATTTGNGNTVRAESAKAN